MFEDEYKENIFDKLHLGRLSKPIVIAIIACVLLVIAFALFTLYSSASASSFTVNSASATEQEASEEPDNNVYGDSAENTSSDICVYISGAVNNPGVCRLSEGARLIDAVEMCGGLTSEASTSAVNMAMVLEDAMQVNVPTETEVANNSVAAQTTASSESSTASASSSTSGLVNINTATSEELQTLSGIGESKANKIITYRQQNGSFKTIDELCNVSGIGEKTLESLRQYICV